MYKSRTDMAVEDMNLGFKYDLEYTIKDMVFKKLTVDDEISKKINKNKGIYYNIDNIDFISYEDDLISIISSTIQDVLIDLNIGNKKLSTLVVGLGNTQITPDSLGPLVISKLAVNRHLEEDDRYKISALSPGVMAQTGMETSEIVKAICDDFKPDLVIVVDALACSVPSRMCHSIQLSTAGINPGAGIGNNRKEISHQSLGRPVLAIGVPTVCDVDVFTHEVENDFFVTPNDIDRAMDILSRIIALGINLSFNVK
jgi:spore protease